MNRYLSTALILLLGALLVACSPQGDSPFTNEARNELNEVRTGILAERGIDNFAVSGIPSIILGDCDEGQRFYGSRGADTTEEDQFYKALGLVPADTDVDSVIELTIPQTFALYSVDATDILWMPEECESGDIDDISTLEKYVYAQSFVGGVQGRELNLRGLVTSARLDNDWALAVSALSLGDRVFTADTYFAGVDDLSDEERENITIENYRDQFYSEDTIEFYKEANNFPFIQGSAFVESIFESGGWEAVETAFTTNRPRSTEHILHPERYLDDDQPIEVEVNSVADVFGAEEENIDLSVSITSGDSNTSGGGFIAEEPVAPQEEPDTVVEEVSPEGTEEVEVTEEIVGWLATDDNTLGEFWLRQHLATQLDAETVDTAATGWGGDSYAVYYNLQDNQRAMILRLAMDTTADFNEFLAAYRTLASARTGAAEAEVQDEGSECWVGDVETVCINTDSTQFYAPDDESANSDEVIIAYAPSLPQALAMIDVQRSTAETE